MGEEIHQPSLEALLLSSLHELALLHEFQGYGKNKARISSWVKAHAMQIRRRKKKKKEMAQPKPAVQKYTRHRQEANSNVRKYRTEYVQNQLCRCGNAYQKMEKIHVCVTKNKVRCACAWWCTERGTSFLPWVKKFILLLPISWCFHYLHRNRKIKVYFLPQSL